MKKPFLVLVLCLMAATLADGKSTKLVTSWKNPEYSGQAFHRILVLGMSAKPGVRADFEDALSKLVTREGVEAIPGNTILLRPEGTKLDIDYLKSQVKTFKIDAVIVSRLVKVDKSITYVPGQPYMPYPYYGSFYGYYGAVYPMVYTPDYLREDTTVRVETNVYAVTSGEGQLVWTGVSDTFNPRSADKVIAALCKLIVQELQKEAIV
ncbi:MAG: hypothetical protein WAM71_17145 [Candidatus Korobacteraceae bacterium]